MRAVTALAVLLPVLVTNSPLPGQSVVHGATTGKPHAATAVILLESSSAHTYSGNQEIYVAELTLSGQKEAQLAKLVDRYPEAASSIDRSVLALNRPLRVRVFRSPVCDTPAKLIFLPSSKQGEYDPEVRQKLAERGEERLPCFLLEHETASLKKP